MGLIPVNFTVLSELFVMFFLILKTFFFLNKTLPYRYFNEFLVLYSDLSDSRQISLLRISS
nr:MAG TPA: hypothetical protein [Bacteriophage sp.]